MLRCKGACLPALLAVMAASATAPALAGNGLYIGATAGTSLFHQGKDAMDTAMLDAFESNGLDVISANSTLKRSSFAFSGVVGYQFIPEIALEASYTDLGKLKYHADDVVVGAGFAGVKAAADLDAKAKGPTVSLLGALPLGPQFEIYVRAGIIFSKVTLDAAASIAGASNGSTASQSANSVDPLAGVGLAWKPTQNWKIRAEYTRFSNVGDKDTTGEINIDTFNVGVTYSFQ